LGQGAKTNGVKLYKIVFFFISFGTCRAAKLSKIAEMTHLILLFALFKYFPHFSRLLSFSIIFICPFNSDLLRSKPPGQYDV
jgi:hypothetical protein